MKQLLDADEFAAFQQSYRSAAQAGLRLNTLKISANDFIKKSPFALEPVGPFEPAGFRLVDERRPGRHPYHAAGLYYLQEPSAMVVAALVDPQPGELILDLAAAPGGKATHLAARMGDEGLLVANDVHRGRARILAENLERWGACNVLVANNTPAQLATALGPIFDRVLLDAPCSGEGMFRKQAGIAWSEAIVAACARRQTRILDTAVQLVKPGGLLAYTTCAFSPEENEGVIGRFLDVRPDFKLAAPPLYGGFAKGRPTWGDGRPELARTIRLWPHRFAGEGHFIALLRRAGAPETTKNPIPGRNRVSPAALHLWQEFATHHLRAAFDEERMVLVNGRYLTLLPIIQLDAAGLGVVRHGLTLGDVHRGHFKPAHALALALTADDVVAALDLPPDAPELAAYLAGHPLPLAADRSVAAGWVLVTVDGFGLGWGKKAGSRLQNHYPRGLRW